MKTLNEENVTNLFFLFFKIVLYVRRKSVLQNKTYRLAYDFHKKWAPFPVTSEDWEKMGLEAAAVCHLHGDDPFLTDLLIAAMNDFGREYVKARDPKP